MKKKNKNKMRNSTNNDTVYLCKNLNVLYSNNILGYFASLSSSFSASTCTKMKNRIKKYK